MDRFTATRLRERLARKHLVPPRAGSVERAVPTLRAVSGWLAGSRIGLVVMALVVGGSAGLGAVAFRWLVYAITWVATGYKQFGQQGRVGSLHVPGLGVCFCS